jgi:hypothetical protein
MMPLLQAVVSDPQNQWNLAEHVGLLIAVIGALVGLVVLLARLLAASGHRIMKSQLDQVKARQDAHSEIVTGKIDAIDGKISSLDELLRTTTAQDAQEHREFRASFMAHGERIGRLEGAVFRPFGRRHDDPPEGLTG